jgi:cytochrome P450
MTSDERGERAVPTGLEITPLNPEFQRDPYGLLGELRRRDPVHRDEMLGCTIVTRQADVDAVLRDRSSSVDPRRAAPGTFIERFLLPNLPPVRSMLFLDAPDHTRLRNLVSKAFSPRAIAEMAPRIQAIVDELVAAAPRGVELDLVEAFTSPFPVRVIAEMIGVDPAHRDDFKRWSDDIVAVFDPMVTAEARARIGAARDALHDYLRREIAARRASPRADLLGGLVAAEEAGERLSDIEILMMCTLLLTAGNVTTTDLVGNGVLLLLANPAEIEKLQRDPSHVKNAVEEILRFDTSVLQVARTPTREVAIGGCPVAAGQSVILSLAAANRDPAANPDPDRFDVTREEIHHLSFGGGSHYCLGAPLARLEAQIALTALFAGGVRLRRGEAPVEWRRVPAFRGPARLPVVLD